MRETESKLTRDEGGWATACFAKYDGGCPVCMKSIMRGEPCLVYDHKVFDKNSCLDEYAGAAVPVRAKKSSQTVVPGAYQDIENQIRELRELFYDMRNAWTEQNIKLCESLLPPWKVKKLKEMKDVEESKS